MPTTRLLSCALLFSACTAVPAIGELDGVEADAIASARPTIPEATAPPRSPSPLAVEPEVAVEPEHDEPTSLPGELPPTDAGPPRLRLAPHPRDGGCEPEVVALGFPAVRDDGSQLAFVQHRDSAGADWSGPLTIETRTHDDEVIGSAFVSDGEAIYDATDGEWGKACRAARAEIEHRIADINATFASGWRPMTRVAVQWPWRIEGGPQLPELGDDAHARPVEALYHAGHFVARVRGVKVLQSTRIPGWRGEEPEMTMNATEPTVVALYHDAATDRAVAELSYESGSCMSDPNVYTRPLTLAPDVLAAATERAAFLIADPMG